jgi:hypothetical protein
MLCNWSLMGPPATPFGKNLDFPLFLMGSMLPSILWWQLWLLLLPKGWQSPCLETWALVLPSIEPRQQYHLLNRDAPGDAADHYVLHVIPSGCANVWGRNVCDSLWVNIQCLFYVKSLPERNQYRGPKPLHRATTPNTILCWQSLCLQSSRGSRLFQSSQ